MMHVQKYSRRHAMALFAAAAATQARAAFREITWDDLIPPGVPYSEIVGPGFMDEGGPVPT